MRKLLLTSILFLTLINMSGYSECPLAKYIIKGIVKEITTKKPINGVKIFVFLDNYEETNAGDYPSKYPDFFVTSSEGKFEATCWFDTFRSYSILGHDCSKKPKSLEVFITKEGYLTKREKFTDKEFKILDQGEVKVIEIPEIYIKPSP